MEYSSSVPNFPSKNSKKRVFSEESSADLNVTEISPPHDNRSSKLQKAIQIKEVNEDDEILTKIQEFKKFDIIQDAYDHHFLQRRTSTYQPSKSWSKKIQEEWKILEKDLPDTILVRVYESRIDLMRAVIVGAEKTPYHDGLFFFDVFFPDNYPDVPPHVYSHSRGLRLNPNLYDDGKVCLSLLNTGNINNQVESWNSKVSTMLQVLVSKQGLVLSEKPFFNHPAAANAMGKPFAEKFALGYNENAFIDSLKNMVFTLQHQPKNFEDFVVGHFFIHAKDILVACKAYIDGAQVGCLDEDDKSCSLHFRESLSNYINDVLVDAFTRIGVKDCHQFMRPV